MTRVLTEADADLNGTPRPGDLPPLPEEVKAAISTFGNVCMFSSSLVAVQASGPLCEAIRTYGQACAAQSAARVVELEQLCERLKRDAERWKVASRSRNHGVVVFTEFGSAWVYDQAADAAIDAVLTSKETQ